MKRIMIFAKRSAFWCGLQRLLEVGECCDLVAWETEVEPALERIRELRPDAVLVDGDRGRANEASPIMRILSEGLGTRVIGLSLDDNTLALYREHRRIARNVDDLIQAIDQDTSAAPGPIVLESVPGMLADSHDQ